VYAALGFGEIGFNIFGYVFPACVH